MHDLIIDRRRFIGAAAGLGALSLLPASALARLAHGDAAWPKVQALLDAYVGDGRLPGAAAAIGRGTGEPDFLFSGTLGRDRPRHVDADTLYRVYSMSKPVTAMAAMMLIEDGRLGLDQDIGDLIPGFKKPRVAIDPEKSLASRPAARPVTVRNLMTHTGGIGYIIVSKGALLKEYVRLGLSGGVVSRKPLPGLPTMDMAPGLEEFANRIASLPLIADPGTRWSYSAGLDILGRVIEVAGRMPFERFLQTRMFDPLGMTSSFFQVPRSELPRLVTNYGVIGTNQILIDGGSDSIYLDKPGFPSGGGGLVMSPRDYDRFLRMLAGHGAIGRTRVMKEATAKLAMSNLMPSDTVTSGTYVDGQGFGAGGRVTITADPLGAGVGTYGWGGAAATIAFVDPSRGVRASGFAQFMPNEAMPFTRDFGKSVYASL